jgi:hypothetical protein
VHIQRLWHEDYYEENKVVMKAVMKIPTRKLAETEFINCPGKGKFKKVWNSMYHPN